MAMIVELAENEHSPARVMLGQEALRRLAQGGLGVGLAASLGRCTLALAGLWLVLLAACNPAPASRDAYAGEPLRAAINAECGPQLRTQTDDPCVQIDVFAEGEGEGAAAGDYLELHYLVLLPDGSELDSSHGGKALSFRLEHSTNIIEGMHIGMTGARRGERRRFVVPPPLAYRGRKMPGLPPDADLTFLVELVERRTEL